MDRVKTELGSKYRNSSISCDCEVCATDAKYCATSIPRLGFMNEDGTGNTEHVRQTRKRRARRTSLRDAIGSDYSTLSRVRPASLILCLYKSTSITFDEQASF